MEVWWCRLWWIKQRTNSQSLGCHIYWAAPAYRLRPICIPPPNKNCSQICGMTCGLRIIVVDAVVITPDRCVGSLENAVCFMCVSCVIRYQYRSIPIVVRVPCANAVSVRFRCIKGKSQKCNKIILSRCRQAKYIYSSLQCIEIAGKNGQFCCLVF